MAPFRVLDLDSAWLSGAWSHKPRKLVRITHMYLFVSPKLYIINGSCIRFVQYQYYFEKAMKSYYNITFYDNMQKNTKVTTTINSNYNLYALSPL